MASQLRLFAPSGGTDVLLMHSTGLTALTFLV
jgi:hypothetical protein